MSEKHKISVLYVEDEKKILSAITKTISRMVEVVYSTSDAFEGIKLFKKHLPDIVITDISMPKMNGIEMLEELNTINKNYKSILIYAYPKTEYFTKAIKLGVSDFIIKPVKNEALFLSINNLAKLINLEKQVTQQQLNIQINEQNYRTICNNIFDSIVIFDIENHKIVDVNSKACEEYGYSYNEITKRTIQELSLGKHPYTEEELKKHFQKCLAEKYHTFEWRAKRKDGSLFWCEINIKKINGLDRILIIINNTEKCKQAESNSKQSERKYYNLFNTANDAIFLIQENKFVDCNKKTLKLFACSKDDIIGASPDVFSPEKQPNGKLSLKESTQKMDNTLNNKNQNFEWLHKKLDGTLFYTNVSLNKTKINNKIYIQAIVRDVTQQKIAEQKLRENQIFLRKITDVSPSNIFVRDTNGKYIFVNKTIADMYGLSIDEMLGKTDFDLIEKTNITIEQAKTFLNDDKKVLEADSLIILPETKLKLPDGSYKHFQTIKKAIVLNNNTKIIIGYSIDITEKKKNIELLEKKQKELQESNTTKDKFFSIIAHDLKNPFGTTMNFAELLMLAYHKNTDEKNIRIINNIYKGAKHAFNLLENLLVWSRSQTNKIQINPTILNLSIVINNVIDYEANRAEEKKILILSKVKDSIQVYTDIDMLNTVIRNLISNAIKFSNISGEITITAIKLDKFVKISISDNGIGIKPEAIKKLFRIDNSNNSTKGTNGETGTGLGLILCKEFVEKNGGKIWAESEVNKGSTFSFTIPLFKPKNIEK